MRRDRLEAFSDGVIAILITIMALELRVRRSAEVAALLPLAPVFLSYVLVAVIWLAPDLRIERRLRG